jgi:hypothetical protein
MPKGFSALALRTLTVNAVTVCFPRKALIGNALRGRPPRTEVLDSQHLTKTFLTFRFFLRFFSFFFHQIHNPLNGNTLRDKKKRQFA